MQKMHMTKNINAKEILMDILMCAGGCILYSIAVNVFAEPNHIVQGGITGLGMLVNYLFPKITTGIAALIFNIPLFIVAWKKIGGTFIFKSFFVTVFLSISIDALRFLPEYQGEKLLAVLFSGVLSGIGLAMIILRGASSGGTDILAKLLRNVWPHMSMGKIIMWSDFLVIVLAGFVYRNLESAMYSLVLIFVSSHFIDSVISGHSHSKAVMVVSDEYEKIVSEITKQLHRGVSIIPVEGGYTGQERKMLISAVRINEVHKVIKIVKSIDERAFTIVCDSSEVIGEGFKRDMM